MMTWKSGDRFPIEPLALSLLQPEIRSCRPNVFAKRCLLAGSFQAASAPFANQGVKDSAIDASWHTHTRRSVMRAEKERLAVEKPSGVATHGGDLNAGTSQSGAFTRRILRKVKNKELQGICAICYNKWLYDCTRPAWSDLHCGFK